MNNFQTQLYNNLIQLCSINERKAFFFADQILDGTTYRIFNYRLASYSDFLEPAALECRGIMFEVDGDVPIRLAAMPMAKFFNVDENPLSTDCSFDDPSQIMIKMDGSLISTFVHNNEIRFKSKGSLHSTQCVDSANICSPELYSLLHWIVNNPRYIDGVTVNLEYTSPTNRIVVGYQESKLTILNVRKHDGTYESKDSLKEFCPSEIRKLIDKFWVDFYPDLGSHSLNHAKYVEMKDVTGFEGYVIQMKDGRFVKTKNDWYLNLHFNKDSVNNPRRLYEAVIEETTDDLRSLFHDDPYTLNKISEMEIFVETLYNPMVERVESFYSENKGLDRKDYAIKGQQELPHEEFGLVMNLYCGKAIDYKAFMKKQWKRLGLLDEYVLNSNE